MALAEDGLARELATPSSSRSLARRRSTKAFRDLVGNTAALPWALYLGVAAAGFGEEMFFRGFLFERFRTLLGPSGGTSALAVIVTAVAHLLIR
jgi:membrane protease YdiL (CAAX protease family)